ncbi:hypothetical protein [Virgibacillus sp. YIM 98842]|uniref:hypothetical protein n=1 Tax=Virgibacillus sp. YIM 98842 TaxID=2663533 RepID=UPI0013DD6CC9|nr:hypothetical protein [Virgibacillus sp. YIM 98842]
MIWSDFQIKLDWRTDIESSGKQKIIAGGTAKNRVKVQLKIAGELFDDNKTWIKQHRA